jgi:RNA polymerase sigma factor (sigma-70 family)
MTENNMEEKPLDEKQFLAQRFEQDRDHLKAVAYRMVGSLSEADDAVQEAWLRLNRSDISGVHNLSGWLTTVVARVCLDMLRSRKSRREAPIDVSGTTSNLQSDESIDPEQEAVLADSVGLALLVVLEKLTPAERLTFVLHDMFDLPFEEIAPIVGRTPTAARQLASRARRRVQGTDTAPEADITKQREVVDAFLAASRSGSFEALVAVLDPDVVLTVDGGGGPGRGTRVFRTASIVAKQSLAASKGARFARPALINGSVGVIVAPRGRLLLALLPKIIDQKIAEIEVISDPLRLKQLDLGVLND